LICLENQNAGKNQILLGYRGLAKNNITKKANFENTKTDQAIFENTKKVYKRKFSVEMSVELIKTIVKTIEDNPVRV
jgi:hypothetical protein